MCPAAPGCFASNAASSAAARAGSCWNATASTTRARTAAGSAGAVGVNDVAPGVGEQPPPHGFRRPEFAPLEE
jgi:hypothetical protein